MTTKTKAPTGYIIYRGPSLLDGKPIVAVAIVGESKNVKTGNLVQTYILVDNGLSPVESARNLLDVSVCGDCKHRRGMGGSCYVNLGQGARSVCQCAHVGGSAEGYSRASLHRRPLIQLRGLARILQEGVSAGRVRP